jgi:hypothetical protein
MRWLIADITSETAQHAGHDGHPAGAALTVRPGANRRTTVIYLRPVVWGPTLCHSTRVSSTRSRIQFRTSSGDITMGVGPPFRVKNERTRPSAPAVEARGLGRSRRLCG